NASDGFSGGVEERRAEEKGIGRRSLEQYPAPRVDGIGWKEVRSKPEVSLNRDRFGGPSCDGEPDQHCRVLGHLLHAEETAGWIDRNLVTFDDALRRRCLIYRQRPDGAISRVVKCLAIR